MARTSPPSVGQGVRDLQAERLPDFEPLGAPLSLLAQLQESDEADSWARFARLYTPLITAWLRKYDVQNSDIDDLMQDVLLAVSKDLPRFERRGPGAFRGEAGGPFLRCLMSL